MSANPGTDGLPLTGERTVPGLVRENYWFRRHELVYEWIAETFAPTGKHVVEAGCGEGYGADMLRQAGAEVTALDYDDQTLQHVAATYPAVTAVKANLDDIPLADDSADMLVSLQVFEHLWDTGRFLAETRRILRPGGTVVISTPNRLTFSPGLGRGEKPTNPFHVEEFDAAQLHDIIDASGYGDVHVLGLFEGLRLRELNARRGDIVQRQVEAILSGDWPQELLDDVSAVTTSDFVVARPDGMDSGLTGEGADTMAASLDLIVVGRA